LEVFDAKQQPAKGGRPKASEDEDVWGPLSVPKEPVGKVPNISEGILDLAGGKTSVAVAGGMSLGTHLDDTKVVLWGNIEEAE